MSDNPLAPSAERDARIRDRAYYLWEADGQPDGGDLEYWERARALVGMEDSPGTGQLPNPMTLHEPMPGVVVEEAAIQENYGEFPDRFADQGERQPVPMTKAARRGAA